jgi:hypothetical protein
LYPVAEEGPEPDLVPVAGERSAAEFHEVWQYDEGRKQREKVQREDAQRAPDVKGTQIAGIVPGCRASLRVIRNPEEDEKKLNADPSAYGRAAQRATAMSPSSKRCRRLLR